MEKRKAGAAKLEKYDNIKKELLENGLWINFHSPYGLEQHSRSIREKLQTGNILSVMSVSEAEMYQAAIQEVCLRYFVGIHSQVTRAIYSPDADKDKTLENIKKLIEQRVFTDEQTDSYVEIAAGLCGEFASKVKPS